MIVVTAPNGNIGHQVIENLLRSAEPIRVIAREPSTLAAKVRERVEVVEGSQACGSQLIRALIRDRTASHSASLTEKRLRHAPWHC